MSIRRSSTKIPMEHREHVEFTSPAVDREIAPERTVHPSVVKKIMEEAENPELVAALLRKGKK